MSQNPLAQALGMPQLNSVTSSSRGLKTRGSKSRGFIYALNEVDDGGIPSPLSDAQLLPQSTSPRVIHFMLKISQVEIP